ncbi:MAG: hypothetical protein AAB367_00145 [Patescibacteria group bacterium]
MEDFLRWAHPGVLGTLGALAFVFGVAWVFLTQPEVEDDVKVFIRRGRNILGLILMAAFIWQLFAAASVNVTPRAVIDRTDVNRQIDRFEDRAGDAHSNAH